MVGNIEHQHEPESPRKPESDSSMGLAYTSLGFGIFTVVLLAAMVITWQLSYSYPQIDWEVACVGEPMVAVVAIIISLVANYAARKWKNQKGVKLSLSALFLSLGSFAVYLWIIIEALSGFDTYWYGR